MQAQCSRSVQRHALAVTDAVRTADHVDAVSLTLLVFCRNKQQQCISTMAGA